MTLPDPTYVSRVLTADEATSLVGSEVDDLPATITAPTVARDAETGEPVFAYLPLGDVADLRALVQDIDFHETYREGSGRRNVSTVFGWAARRPLQRRESCNATRLAKEEPAHQATLDRWAVQLQDVLEQVEPGIVEAARETVEVLPEWRMAGGATMWTSGVINRTSQLPYHRDAFNFPVWSAMPVLRRGLRGGFLSLPEYGATLACRDGWGAFFAGYNLVHGVTPMHRTADDGYRYSIVYYALRGMKDCHTYAEETRYGQAKRTERERRQADLVREKLHSGLALPGVDLALPSEADLIRQAEGLGPDNPALIPDGDPSLIAD